MNAFASTQSNLFLNAATAPAGSLTHPWSQPRFADTRDSEASIRRAARRELRRNELENGDWLEFSARVLLIVSMLSAYAAVIWQVGSL